MAPNTARSLLALALLAGARVPAAAQPAPEVSSAAVTLDGKPLFTLSARVLSFSPAERAAAVSGRLKELAGERRFADLEVEARPDGGALDLVLGGRVLATVTPADAEAARLPLETLARREAEAIDRALAAYRAEHGAEALLRSAGLAAAFLVALLLALALLGKTLPAAKAAVQARRAFIPALRLQRLELVPGERIADLAAGLLDVGHKALVLLLLYLFIPLVLSLFPATRGWAETITHHALDPLKAIASAALGYLPKLFFIVVVLAVVRYALKVLHLIVPELERGRVSFPGFHRDWAAPTFQLVRFLIFVFTAVVIFPYLPGSDSPAFKGISVFLGVLISFGGGSAISNLVSGAVLTYMRPFAVGDRVKIADTVGDVVERTLLVTRLRTIKNVDVTIPNAIILGAHIVNYSSSAADRGLILHTSVTIGYDAPWRKVHALLLAAAKDIDGVLAEPKPFVLQTALGDFSVRYELNAYTREPARTADLESALHAGIQDRFAEAGVEIMSPAFEVRRSGPASTVPSRD